jgi:hypothetical protein
MTMINRPLLNAYLIAGIGLLVALSVTTFNYFDLKNETRIRADQSCTLFESNHKRDVDDLIDTYKYLNSLTPKETKETLNQFIIAILPKQEEIARVDSAPDYCDETIDGEDIGLPEPDPVLPVRQDFSDLLVHPK